MVAHAQEPNSHSKVRLDHKVSIDAADEGKLRSRVALFRGYGSQVNPGPPAAGPWPTPPARPYFLAGCARRAQEPWGLGCGGGWLHGQTADAEQRILLGPLLSHPAAGSPGIIPAPYEYEMS